VGHSTFDRRWTTLLNADIVGYSALTALDEFGAMSALLQNMNWLCRAVERYGGRVIDATGDNLLAAFDDETSALRCALEAQLGTAERNRGVAPELHMQLRIAIHSGEVVHHAGRVFGNAVNVSARLQNLAAPCGVIVAHASAERIQPALLDRQRFDDASHRLRNIPDPVAALQWRSE
jgi:class 3 adenylate cyclase